MNDEKYNSFWNTMIFLVFVPVLFCLIILALNIGESRELREGKSVRFNSVNNNYKTTTCLNLLNDNYMQHVSYSQKPEYEYVRRNGIYVRCLKETLTCNGSITQTQIINVFPNTVEHRENVKSFCAQCNGTDLKNDSPYTSDINYKAEYAKLISKKKDIEKMTINFRTQIEVYNKKIAIENTILKEFKKLLERYQIENNSVYFKTTLLQYNSQNMKIQTLKKIKSGYQTGLKNLEKALDKLDISINEMKVNLDTVAYKKLLTDAYKDINSMLESIKGISTDGCTIDVEKLNEEFIREGVKMDVLSKTDTPDVSNKTYSPEEMKNIIDKL